MRETRDRLREVQLDPNRPIFRDIGKEKSQRLNNKTFRLSCTECPCRLTYMGKAEWVANEGANIRQNKNALERLCDSVL